MSSTNPTLELITPARSRWELRRGHGASVNRIAPPRSPVAAKARELVAVARRYRFWPDDLAEIIEQVSWESS